MINSHLSFSEDSKDIFNFLSSSSVRPTYSDPGDLGDFPLVPGDLDIPILGDLDIPGDLGDLGDFAPDLCLPELLDMWPGIGLAGVLTWS